MSENLSDVMDWVAAARVRACARYGVLVVGEEMKQRCYPSHR